MARRAKIVATLGPACATYDQVLGLVVAGLDVARLNLSHGTYKDHQAIYEHVRTASDAVGRGVGILVDLQGPKIRLGMFADGSALLTVGETFTITTDDISGHGQRVSTTYGGLAGDVGPGDTILIDDGRVSLLVNQVTDTDVITTVTEGGRVSDHKGINLPGVPVSVPAMSEKGTPSSVR